MSVKNKAHDVVAKIIEDVITDRLLDDKINLDIPQEEATAIAKEVEAIMNWHVAQSKKKVYALREVRKMLIEMAAEMVRGEGIPVSTHREDWKDLPRSLTKKGWAEIYRAAFRCEDTCKNWGHRLRKLADAIDPVTVKRVCCGCGDEFDEKQIPGPPDFPPFSCGKPECEEARVKKIRRDVG